MGRFYAATFEAVACTAAQDLFELVAASNVSVIIHAIYLSQHTDFGDAADELVRVRIRRGQSTSGSGGSTNTPAALTQGVSAASTTVEINNTTQASTGTIVVLLADAWNVRSGYQFVPTPEARPTLSGGSRMTVELVAAPADSLTMNGTIIFEEI